MCFVYLLGFLFVLGCNGESSNAKIFEKLDAIDDSEKGNEKMFTPTENPTGLDSERLLELEETINIVYEGFFGPPPMKLTLRGANESRTSPADTVSIIGDAIRDKLRDISKKFGISPRSFNGRSYEVKLNGSEPLGFFIFYQLMKMPLEMRPIVRTIKDRMYKYIERNNYVGLGYNRTRILSLRSVGSGGSGGESWAERLENLTSLNLVKTCSERLYDCLEPDRSSYFDVKRALGKLMSLPPETVRKTLHRRLRKPIPKHPQIRESDYDRWQAFFCHSVAGGTRFEYRDCLVEAIRVDACMKARVEDCSSSENEARRGAVAGEPSRNFIDTVESLDEMSCVDAGGADETNYFTECSEDNWKYRVKNTERRSYVRDAIMGDLKKWPILRRMANDLLAGTVVGSDDGADALREIASLLGIYENGMRARDRLAKSTRTKDIERRDELTEKLADYERHAARISFGTIEDANEIMSNVEKLLVDSAAKVSRRPDLSGNVSALRCFSTFLASIIRNCFDDIPTNSGRNDTELPANRTIKSVRNDGLNAETAVGFTEMFHDESLKHWMNAMQRMGETSSASIRRRPHRRSAALISLANNFLLAIMFYECIAVLAASIYSNDRKSEQQQNSSGENVFAEGWSSRGKRTDHRYWSTGKRDGNASFV